jgi:tRNA (cmo5U34)-methyltransferase
LTGVDLTEAMLDVLKQKHPDKDMTLIHASYFDYDFGSKRFDAILSFQTMHHFSHDQKTKLYSRVYAALRPDGKYLECDYMAMKLT